MHDFPQYDEIYIISDIHMGGSPGFQILRETERLANFIRWVAMQRPEGRLALILNGDIVDTLAEDIPGYIAIDEALSTVRRIMYDPSFKQVWDALAYFVRQAGRTLIMVIGNHDIEIAFPIVQQLILTSLAGEEPVARSRIEFATTGAGYACLVGKARIFCTHGNEVDAWNYVRYEDLSKVARRLNAGRSLSGNEWEPNAGTKMVKDVMNGVKRKYAWIDLLKPEIQAAVGTLLVLEPSQIGKIKSLIPVIGERLRGHSEVDQRLAAEGYRSTAPSRISDDNIAQLLGPHLREGLKYTGVSSGQSTDDMLLAAEKNFYRYDTVISPENDVLGVGQVIWDRLTGWLTGVGQDEALRRALKDWVRGDTSFDIDNRDETYTEVTKSVGSRVDFIVTGHTHLERAIALGAGRYYFNCGTWIRLLRLTDKMLQDTVSFRPVYEVLIDGSMETIDNAIFDDEPFVMNQTSAVCIKTDGDKVVGQLLHVEGNGTGTVHEMQTFTRP